MKKVSTLASLIAAALFALAPAALAQTTTTDQPPGHTSSPTEPSAAQNNPDRGAQDPARVGTITSSNQDKNNNRNPSSQERTVLTDTESTDTQVTTSPSTTYETTTQDNTRYTATQDTTTTDTTDSSMRRDTLPRTASPVPLAALAGLLSLGGALSLRVRRYFQ
jgi:hypothetical protein